VSVLVADRGHTLCTSSTTPFPFSSFPEEMTGRASALSDPVIQLSVSWYSRASAAD
jgi:hypothetical protein